MLSTAKSSHLAGQQVQVEAGVSWAAAPQDEHAAGGAAAVAEHQDLQRRAMVATDYHLMAARPNTSAA